MPGEVCLRTWDRGEAPVHSKGLGRDWVAEWKGDEGWLRLESVETSKILHAVHIYSLWFTACKFIWIETVGVGTKQVYHSHVFPGSALMVLRKLAKRRAKPTAGYPWVANVLELFLITASIHNELSWISQSWECGLKFLCTLWTVKTQTVTC